MSDTMTRGDDMVDCMNTVFIGLNTVERLLSSRSLSEPEPDLDKIIELVKQFIANRDQNYENVVESLSEEGFYEYYNKICELTAVLILFMPLIEGGIEKERLHCTNLLSQVFLGHYHTGDVTGEGTLLQILAGVIGVDASADILNTVHNVTNWKWTWGHAGKTALELAMIVPLIGVLKYLDKLGPLLKGARKAKLDLKLMEELAKSGVKYTPSNVVMVTKTPDGKLMWLETGGESAGLQHIIAGKEKHFMRRGISDIPEFLKKTLNTTPVKTGKNAKGLYAEYLMDGKKYRVAYGTNGYVVSFYPIE